MSEYVLEYRKDDMSDPHAAERALSYAFGRVLDDPETDDEDKTDLLHEVRAEGILLGVDQDRVNELYLEVLAGTRVDDGIEQPSTGDWREEVDGEVLEGNLHHLMGEVRKFTKPEEEGE